MTKPCENPGENRTRARKSRRRSKSEDGREEQLAAFIDYLKALKRDPSTIRTYAFGARRFFAWLDGIGVADLRAVGREHIRAYQAEVSETDLAPYTVHSRMRAVRRLYDYLEANGKVLLNPASGVRMPKLEHRLPRTVLTKREVRRILDAPDTSLPVGVRDKAMLEVFYSTGLRLAELCALTVYDVDVLNGYVRVNSGKGCKDRVVPLGYKARKYVNEYLRKVRGKFTKKNRDERALFVSNRQRGFSTTRVCQIVRHYAALAGIRKRVSPHVFRHTCATHMLADGADVVHVQRLLGHVLLNTTQVYTRVAQRDVKATHGKTHPREKDKD